MRHQNQNHADELLFLNTPISRQEQDVIGVSAYVKKLSAAVDADAQMIAITSPFGSGKTSITELFEQKRKAKKGEQIIKISMWSQLYASTQKDSTTDLHKAFVYQLSNQICHKRGSYINRRLSPNYSLLKVHVNKKRYWFLFLTAFTMLIFSWLVHFLPNEIASLFPLIEQNIDSWATGLSLIGIVIGLFVLMTAEIVISAKQESGKRQIESTEIIDIYRHEILKYRTNLFGFAKISRRIKKGKRYVVIIEDLDRTGKPRAVIDFLKELRKYYIPNRENSKGAFYKNTVVFIVNVMPEALLEEENTVTESLYAKLFDYVLNLQTINVDNYDAILEGLLREKQEYIKALGLQFTDRLTEIQGMKWIIRERRLGIREIKERLNMAFSIYESLKIKFPQNTNLKFEKCAVVAYLKTAFERDFYNTDDRAFQKLVNLFIQNELTEEECQNLLKNTGREYQTTVQELIEAKLIDGNYRTYFYNYPQGSYLYNLDEQQIINAILYKEQVDEIEKIAQRVVASNSLAPQRSLHTLKQLGLLLPDVVFQSETLYLVALKESAEEIYKYLETIDYSAAKLIIFFKKIISYDMPRKIYKKEHAERLCELWEKHFSETILLQLRAMLCKEFPGEILWYNSLFYGEHALIKAEEINMLALLDAISLVNLEGEDFTVETIRHILQCFTAKESVEDTESKQVEAFLRAAGKNIEPHLIVPLYLQFMKKMNVIVPDFEEKMYNLIGDEGTKEREIQETISQYQEIINQTSENLSKQTFEYINKIGYYDGYSIDVAEQLYQHGHWLCYVYILLEHGQPIPFERDGIKEAIKEFSYWRPINEKYRMAIRSQLVCCKGDLLLQYSFMFQEDCPVLTRDEFQQIVANNKGSDLLILELVPAKLVTEDNYEMLSNFFNRKKQGCALTFKILAYVSTFVPEVSALCFYALNFDMIQYHRIAAAKKAIIKEAFSETLKLSEPAEKIRFMEKTKFLDASWENELVAAMKEDDELKRAYVKAVNNNERISLNTIQTLCKLGSIYSMKPLVSQKFLECKKYIYYVVSSTLRNGQFTLDEGELQKELWPSYIEIFSDQGYNTTRQYMSKNHEFLCKIMANKEYEGLSEENRMQLRGIQQNKDSILDVMDYGTEFALEYYSSMDGFTDIEAATAFVAIVEKNIELIASDELYNHTHGKLINGPLKARYTNIRKKNGYGVNG